MEKLDRKPIGPEEVKFINDNMGWAITVAKRMHDKYQGTLDFDDVKSYALEGLVEAAQVWDPTRGASTTVVAVRCMCAINRMIQNESYRYPMRIPCHAQTKYRIYNRRASAHESLTGEKAPLPQMPMYDASKRLVERTVNDMDIQDDHPSALEVLQHRENHDLANLALKSIEKERDGEIIVLRYYFNYTLEEIGKIYGLTRERIRQIVTKTLAKMRRVLDRMT